MNLIAMVLCFRLLERIPPMSFECKYAILDQNSMQLNSMMRMLLKTVMFIP